MDKKLFITCLKENFEYLDFWEKYGPPAKEAIKIVDHHYNMGGSPDPGTWDKKVLKAFEALQAFTIGAREFSIGTGCIDFWQHGLRALDPTNKEPMPDYLPIDFIQKPAIAQIGDKNRPQAPKEVGWTVFNTDTPAPSERKIMVNLSKKKSEILNDFKKFLDRVDKFRTGDDVPGSWKDNYAQWSPDTSRDRAEAWAQLRVWRMRKERIPFAEIAKGLKITADAAKKAFYKAFERTQGRAYNPDRYRKDGQKMNPWDMTKTCQTCPDRQTCSELCPEIMRFVDQDYTGRKEALDDKGITDFKQYERWQERQKKAPLLNY